MGTQKSKPLKNPKTLGQTLVQRSLPLSPPPLPPQCRHGGLEEPNYELIHEGSFTFSTSSTSSRRGDGGSVGLLCPAIEYTRIIT